MKLLVAFALMCSFVVCIGATTPSNTAKSQNRISPLNGPRLKSDNGKFAVKTADISLNAWINHGFGVKSDNTLSVNNTGSKLNSWTHKGFGVMADEAYCAWVGHDAWYGALDWCMANDPDPGPTCFIIARNAANYALQNAGCPPLSD